MKITICCNIKKNKSEDQAEFDSIETIEFIKDQIASLGYNVDFIDVDQPLISLINEINDKKPDLIFNIAEGSIGNSRAAFYPALYEQLKIPYTGSDQIALTITSNKILTKKYVNCNKPTNYKKSTILNWNTFPKLIVKPIFEGSSKGITDKSVVSSKEELLTLLSSYKYEYMIEEYIDGIDVSVPWIEGIGVLEPCSYEYSSLNKNKIYDLSLKRSGENLVKAEVPAKISPNKISIIKSYTTTIVKALNIKDFARLDFRVAQNKYPPSYYDRDSIYFLEINPLPSLAQGDDAETYKALALINKKPSDMFESIINSAKGRFKL